MAKRDSNVETNENERETCGRKFEYHQGPLRAALGSREHAFHSRFHYCKADHQRTLGHPFAEENALALTLYFER